MVSDLPVPPLVSNKHVTVAPPQIQKPRVQEITASCYHPLQSATAWFYSVTCGTHWKLFTGPKGLIKETVSWTTNGCLQKDKKHKRICEQSKTANRCNMPFRDSTIFPTNWLPHFKMQSPTVWNLQHATKKERDQKQSQKKNSKLQTEWPVQQSG